MYLGNLIKQFIDISFLLTVILYHPITIKDKLLLILSPDMKSSLA